MKFHKPQDGDRRSIRRFAFLPISDEQDTYWLEWVDIDQRYCEYDGSIQSSAWVNEWVIGDTDRKEEAR